MVITDEAKLGRILILGFLKELFDFVILKHHSAVGLIGVVGLALIDHAVLELA